MTYYDACTRAAAYDDIVISPHLDDAAYSLAGTLLAARRAGRRVLVVSVFGHGMTHAPSGKGPFDGYVTREREDRDAMRALDVDYVWLNLPEMIFRTHTSRELIAIASPSGAFEGTPTLARVRDAMNDVVAAFADVAARVHVPLAIGAHPDHRLVFEAARELDLEYDVHFYEDLPYALYPALVAQRLAHVAGGPLPSRIDVARDLARFAFRGVGRTLSFLPMLLYVTCARLFARAPTRRARVSLIPEARDVSTHLAHKADVMRLYASQTPLFFEDPSRLEDLLTDTHGAPIERVWRCAS